MGYIKPPLDKREKRRQNEREARKRLTPEQFEELQSMVIDREVNDRVRKILDDISEHLVEALRTNHIGKDRVLKICQDFMDLCKAGGKEK